MIFGIICGLSAALLNSIGFLFSGYFVKKYKSSFALLIYAQIWMFILSIPILFSLFPSNGISELRNYLIALIAWVIVFCLGQGALFMAQRTLEPSKISSLLGLKIIILTIIYMLVKHQFPNIGQWIAIFMAAAAGILINWKGNMSFGGKGMLFVFVTLICFPLADITETSMVLCFVHSGIATLKSAIIATAAAYTVLGVISLPGLFFIERSKDQFLHSLGYALPWMLSQILLFSCFALLLPVFANVLLAFRGAFSVFLGASLAWFGFRNLDADITKKEWILRGIAAALMIAAIGLYSYSTTLH